MAVSTRAGVAAALLAAATASPGLAQGYGSQSGYAQPAYGAQAYPPSTYDRGASAYPASSPGRPSQYDQTRRPGDTDQAERYGQPDRYGQEQGQAQGQGQGQDDGQDLARQLGLTASQRSAFDTYRRAFAPEEARGRQEDDEMRRMASMTTPQRLDASRAALARDRADFDRTDAATRSFYAQLSAAQRRTFDRLTAPQMDEDGGDQDGPSPAQPAERPPR